MITAGLLTGQMVLVWVSGLAFFSSGLAIALEAGRPSLMDKARALRLLAIFSMLYGLHEMLEVWLFQLASWGRLPAAGLIWIRWILLVVSFAALMMFSVNNFQLPSRWSWLKRYAGGVILGLCILSLLLAAWAGGEDWLSQMEGYPHSLLALLGGMAVGAALYLWARQCQAEGRPILATSLRLAGWAIGLYGFAQVFGISLNQSLVGLVVSQVARTALAVTFAIGLIRMVQIFDQERADQLHEALQARQEAEELLQQEKTRQELLRQQVLRQTIIAQEDERTRIPRELHDETAQILTAFTLQLAAIKHTAVEHPGIRELCNRLQDLSRQMSQSLYRLVHDLRPAQLDDLGLISALHYLSGDVKRSFNLDARLKVTGTRLALDPLAETVIFRVTQEALTNVARHSKMDQAMVELRFEDGHVILRVRDEGVGFNPQKDFAPPRGLGLIGMRERVEAVGGQFRLDSYPLEGTLVEAVIPISGSAMSWRDGIPGDGIPGDGIPGDEISGKNIPRDNIQGEKV